MVSEPSEKARLVFLSRIRVWYQVRSDFGSPFSICTLTVEAFGGTGSQGFAVGASNPAFGADVHCMGVRSPSRPLSFGQPVRPTGSFTSSFRVGGVVFMPISSP